MNMQMDYYGKNPSIFCRPCDAIAISSAVIQRDLEQKAAKQMLGPLYPTSLKNSLIDKVKL